MKTLHWLINPLKPIEIIVLRCIRDEYKRSDKPFETARLIAEECADFDGEKVTITDKGRDALNFYEGEI